MTDLTKIDQAFGDLDRDSRHTAAVIAEVRERSVKEVREWRWQTQEGLRLKPVDMATRHVHHCLVMLWHHTMPREAWVRPMFRKYQLGARFTPEYIKLSVAVLMRELASRPDIQPWMADELRRMQEFLHSKPAPLGRWASTALPKGGRK